ncbi:MAG: membrane dipeptidase [Candidatus Latescibacteria bacterium]|nr:membrane dipeptidase [Candidatus Latescibacterota bacterium]
MPDANAPQVALSPTEAARAQALHERSIVVLAHDHLYGPEDVAAMRQGGVTAKVVKLTVDSIVWDAEGRRVSIDTLEGWTKRGLATMDAVHRFVEAHPGEVMIVRGVADILTAKQQGMTGLILSFEGPRPIEGSLEILRTFYRLGLRELQLTWAAPNQLITDWRLNELGQAVVQEMNRVGMLIDLSHLQDAAFWQVLELSQQPVIVSHTACYAVSGKGDTLTDEKIRALAARGGVIGLHFVSGDYITPRHGTTQAILDDLIDHIDHIRSLVGIDTVALGGDYFLTAPDDTWAWVKEVEHISLMPNLTRGLVKRGYTDEEIEKVLSGNLLRLFRQVWRE